MIGETIGGRYEIVRALGEGGMGAVYEARQIATGRRVALKMIHPDKLRTPQLVARFEVEARAAGGIESEHVVQVLDVDYDEAKKIPFLAMELLVGEGLDALLDRHGKLPQELVLRIGVQICRGLERAHACGILHRDIKPANLFLNERDGEEVRIKIVDFGLAKVFASTADNPIVPKLTATGMLLGSPHYMSPEQARGSRDLDVRTDVWSLGMVLYELLTGRTAFAGVTPLTKVIEAITTQPVTPIRALEPGVELGVASTVERALEISPHRRYASVTELRESLERYLRGEPKILRRMLDELPRKERVEPPPQEEAQPTVVERAGGARAALMTAGAVGAGPTKPSGGPMTNAPPRTEAGPRPNVIPVELATEPPERLRRASAPAGTLVSGSGPALAVAKTGESSPITERGAPRTLVFREEPRIPAPPPAERRRESSRLVPLVAAGAVAAGLAVGAYQLLRGGGQKDDDSVMNVEGTETSVRPDVAKETPEGRARPAASAAAAPETASPLVGAWKSESGRLLEGVAVGDVVELRIKDNTGFAEQGYTLGEAKFTLRPRPSAPGTFEVTDHARPLPPRGAAYDAAALASCVVNLARVAGRPLVAKLEGDALVVEQAALTTGPSDFRLMGNVVVGCKLEQARSAIATSKLSRQR